MIMFYFAIIAIVGALFVLFAIGDGGSLAGLDGDQIASLVFLSLIGTLVASGLIAGRQRLGSMARQALIWTGIVVMLIAGYEYRYELQNAASRVSAGLIPGSPMSATGADGSQTVTITRNRRHFATSARVNGEPLRFIIDTGASTVVLTHEDADAIGFDTSTLDYVIPVATANGMTRAAPISLQSMEVGGIVRRDVAALVAEPGQLFENLLGMNFLDTLAGFEVRGDRLILRD